MSGMTDGKKKKLHEKRKFKEYVRINAMSQKQECCFSYLRRHLIRHNIDVFFKDGLICIHQRLSRKILTSYDPVRCELLLSDKWRVTNNWELVVECAISQAQCVRENRPKRT